MSYDNNDREWSRLIFDRILRVEEGTQRIETMLANAPRDQALREAVRVLSLGMHAANKRPCDTCQSMSKALGEPFGCDSWRELLREKP